MRNADDRMLEEAYKEINEGFLDKVKGGIASTKAGIDAGG